MSFRGFLIFALFVASLFWSWGWGVTRGGVVRFVDDHPTAWKADVALFLLASFHELFNEDDRALPINQRILKLFPKSPYAEDAQFNVASILERERRWPESLTEYLVYVEKYPQGKFVRSVKKNIEYLRSR